MKKTIKYAIVAALGAIAGATAVFVAIPSFDPVLKTSYKTLGDERLKVICAQDELLHQVYEDNEDYWNDVLVETDAYHALDEARDHDWEAFYCY